MTASGNLRFKLEPSGKRKSRDSDADDADLSGAKRAKLELGASSDGKDAMSDENEVARSLSYDRPSAVMPLHEAIAASIANLRACLLSLLALT